MLMRWRYDIMSPSNEAACDVNVIKLPVALDETKSNVNF